ncbi:MAG: glutathione S-transferase family protein [Beijerinckiaceae bacterium]
MSAPVPASRETTIYSVAACPYAQRTRILLDLKNIDAKLVEVDLSKKRPDWFLAINPTGKVPVLVHDGKPLNESSVINEYLEDVFPDPPVFSTDPYRKAFARILVDYCNTTYATNMYRLLMEQDATRRPRIEAAANKDWIWLEEMLTRLAPDQDFPFGRFGMAELTYAPFFLRYALNEYFWGYAIPKDLPRVRRWRQAVLDHEAVKATALPADHYLKLYADYALGFANGAVPPGRERSALDPSCPLDESPLPPRRVATAS